MGSEIGINEAATSPSESRLQILDLLRGFALSGILIINAMSILAVVGSTPAFTVPIALPDRILQDLILFFVESKFFTLFSLLFGIGFAIQIQSAGRQGFKFLPRIIRRMIGLAIFGLMHIFLLWDGDILVIYAFTGTLLLLFVKQADASLRKWIISLLAIPALLVLIILVGTLIARLSAQGAISLSEVDTSIKQDFANTTASQILASNGFVTGIAERVQTYVELLPLLISRIPTVLAMFLLGLLLGRGGIIQELPEKVETLKKVRFWGLSLGLALMGLILVSTKFLPATSALVAIIEDQYLAGPILCLGYASALTLAFIRKPDRKIFRHFSIVGRMALTNYLGQSLVLTFISYGWGLGLALQLTGFQVLGICIVLFICQISYSHWWLSKFRYGPCEWAWRCVTYWKIVAIKS